MLGLGLGIGKGLLLQNLVASIVKSFKARVATDGGTFEAESCLKTTLTNLKNIQ